MQNCICHFRQYINSDYSGNDCINESERAVKVTRNTLDELP